MPSEGEASIRIWDFLIGNQESVEVNKQTNKETKNKPTPQNKKQTTNKQTNKQSKKRRGDFFDKEILKREGGKQEKIEAPGTYREPVL